MAGKAKPVSRYSNAALAAACRWLLGWTVSWPLMATGLALARHAQSRVAACHATH